MRKRTCALSHSTGGIQFLNWISSELGYFPPAGELFYFFVYCPLLFSRTKLLLPRFSALRPQSQRCQRQRKRRAPRPRILPSSLRTYWTVTANHPNPSRCWPPRRRPWREDFPFPKSGSSTFLALSCPRKGSVCPLTTWSAHRRGGTPTRSARGRIFTELKVKTLHPLFHFKKSNA